MIFQENHLRLLSGSDKLLIYKVFVGYEAFKNLH